METKLDPYNLDSCGLGLRGIPEEQSYHKGGKRS